MKCQGLCEEHGGHSGKIVRVKVTGKAGDWGAFHYCETARRVDTERGLTVLVIGEAAAERGEPLPAAGHEVTVHDLYGDGSAFKLMVNGYGIAVWSCKHDPREYAEEVARCLRAALAARETR